jgi:S-adenosylmethionine synthetase
MSQNYFFTSESVGEGHPDKICDQISDAILDAYLEQCPTARVACETLVKTGLVVVAGEITAPPSVKVDIPKIVRRTINGIGFNHSDKGFDGNTCAVMVALEEQSPDIAQGVDEGQGLDKEQGAGDQGMMFGYAINETPQLMPASIQYSHDLMRELSRLRKIDGAWHWVRPDSKAQVTLEYRSGKIARIDSVVVSTQHAPRAHDKITRQIIDGLIRPTLPSHLIDDKTKFYVNPTGKFEIGGPMGDSGLTGRKIIVDTYGGHAAHGGGAFSGKDPSKVDRSAAYMGRYIAKNLVASGVCTRAQVQIAYAIGVANPVSVMVDTFGTASVPDEKLVSCVRELFPLKPKQLIDHLGLLKPIYQQTAAYGHFGRDEFPWEKTDMVAKIKEYLGKFNTTWQ